MPGRRPATEDAVARVLVVAGYSAVRAGLQALLVGEPCLRLLGDTTAEADSLHRLIGDLRPDVLLIDSSADSAAAGVDSLGRVLTTIASPATTLAAIPAVVAVGNAPERDLARLAASELPGWGYLLRGEAAGAQIVGAVKAAAAGLVVLDPALPLARRWSESAETVPLPEATVAGETLTPRELEVLQLMAEGLPNKIIASRLKISLHTAKFHVAQILGKLDAASRTEAVTIGARRGFLTL